MPDNLKTFDRCIAAVLLIVGSAAIFPSGSAAQPPVTGGAAIERRSLDSQCIETGEHKSMTFFLIDRSQALSKPDELISKIAEIKGAIRPGERVVTAIGSDRSNGIRIVLDLVRPVKTIWESPKKVQQRQLVYNGCFTALAGLAGSAEEVHRGAALFDSLNFAAAALNADSSPTKKLVIYADMIQDTETISFFLMKKVDPAAVLAKVQGANMIPALDGVEVRIGGAGSGVAAEKASSIEAFWRLYFTAAKGILKSYGPQLQLN